MSIVDILVWGLLGAGLIMAPAAQQDPNIPFGTFFAGVALWWAVLVVIGIAAKVFV